MAFDGFSPYLIGVYVTERGTRGPNGEVLEARSVRRMLSNESYAGVDYYGLYRCIGSKGQKRSVTALDPSEAIKITGFTPPIISRELFDGVQERPKMRQAKSSSSRFYLLTGFTRFIHVAGGSLAPASSGNTPGTGAGAPSAPPRGRPPATKATFPDLTLRRPSGHGCGRLFSSRSFSSPSWRIISGPAGATPGRPWRRCAGTRPASSVSSRGSSKRTAAVLLTSP